MRVLVTGGRDYNDWATLCLALDALNPSVIIQGECPYGGADKLAARYAEQRQLPCIGMRAHFRTMGRAAGPIRNEWMLAHAGPVDTVLAFPGGSGTASMVKKARQAGIHVTEVGFVA